MSGDLRESILALEIRPRRFGYAVLHAGTLIDWGGRGFPAGKSGVAKAVRRVVSLVSYYAPGAVVTRRTRRVNQASAKAAAQVAQRIRARLRREGVTLVSLRRENVREAFATHGYRNKDAVAALIASRFGQLRAAVPHPRKKWEPERHVLAVFDAVATAMVFLGETITSPATEP